MSDTQNTDQGVNATNTLEELVGPGKKFENVEALAEGKLKSDLFIKKLEEENAEIREELTKQTQLAQEGVKLSDILKEVRDSNSEGGDNQGLQEEDLHKLIHKIVEGRESDRTASENRDVGNQLLLQKVGGDADAAKTYLSEKAKELGMTEESLVTLSEKSPKAFAQLIGGEASTPPQGGSPLDLEGRVNPLADTGQAKLEINGHRTNAWYNQKRQEMGSLAFLNDKSLQIQMLRDREALGTAYWGSQ